MTTEELYINGKRIELSAESKIAQTFQANNIAELQDRQGGFTNQFKIPKTQNNREALEHLDNVNSATTIPYRKNTADFIVDGIPTVSGGIATIVGSDQDYNVSVNSGNLTYFDSIPSDLKISDLLIPGTEHINSYSEVKDSRSNNSGFIYPLIDWFNSSKDDAFNDQQVDTKYLLPCLFVRDIIQAVDQLTGWTTKGSLIDSEDYPNMIITPAALVRTDAQKAKYTTSSSNSIPVSFTGNGIQNISYDTFGYGFDGTDYFPDQGIYGYMSLRGAVYWENTTGSPQTGFFRVRIWRSGIEVFTEDTEGQTVAPGATGEFYFDAVSVNRTFNAADNYFTTIEPISLGVSPTYTLDVNTKWTFNLIDGMPYNSLIPTVELYDLTVKDFFQDILNLDGVLAQTNALRKELYLNFFEDIQDRIPNAKKWSEYILPKTFSLSYKFGNYGQTNYLRFAEDSTVTFGIGDASFPVDDETLPDIQTVIQMNTSATDEEVRYQNKVFPRIKALEFGSREMDDVNYRFLLLRREDTVFPVEYFDADGNTEIVFDSIPFAVASPLYFSTKVNTRYATLQSMLRKAKPIKVDMLTSAKIIQELDFLDPVYLEVHHPYMEANGYFYLNMISNYYKGRSTLELIRL